MTTSPQPIKIAILAMGGEGGGVLADWIVGLAEHAGWIAQATSVPGVAQRTGATIYYVEIVADDAAASAGARPVLALAPLPGDVDLVLASELMEAGRAVQRGLVTPARTTLVASTHRVWSIAEKSALGDGRADSVALLAHARGAAQRFVGFDMAHVAAETGSLLSAVLFGALAGTKALPFARAEFEATIERGGVGVAASRRAFAAGFAQAESAALAASSPAASAASEMAAGGAGFAGGAALPATPPARPPAPRDAAVAALVERASRLPEPARALALEGVRRTIDWQDPAYASLYLDRLERVQRAAAPAGDALVAETARHLALWMTYEDTIRVAALKTRATRFARVRGEVRAKADQLLAIDEYLHPRLQEICEVLPVRLGRWLQRPGWPRRAVERLTREGRVVTTSSLPGFMLLYAIAGLRRWRRASLRYAVEHERIDAWLATIEAAARRDPALALEIAQCQRLVKGYGDTHERGWRHFGEVMQVVARAGATLAPATVRELREAALADERGDALRSALARHAPA